MGHSEVAQGGVLLRTLLGSCIGVAIYDQRRQIAGLAHVVLPRANGQTAPPGKYADTAIPDLLLQIERLGGRARQLAAKFAGGANMFGGSSEGKIGEQNIAAVEELLKNAGVPILGRHCGGSQGRRMAVEADTGRVIIEMVGAGTIEL
jgi:chemotaxis protein CheD